eukprot:3281923-Rhodomonas_salina.1
MSVQMRFRATAMRLRSSSKPTCCVFFPVSLEIYSVNSFTTVSDTGFQVDVPASVSLELVTFSVVEDCCSPLPPSDSGSVASSSA